MALLAILMFPFWMRKGLLELGVLSEKTQGPGSGESQLPGILSVSALPLAGCFATGGSLFSGASWYPSRRALPRCASPLLVRS